MACEQRMTVVVPARSACALPHAAGTLMRAALFMAVVCVAAGCGRSANSSDAGKQPVRTEPHLHEGTASATNRQVLAETALARHGEEFARKVNARTVIAALLNNARAGTATYESVSNAVAGISSGEIISCVMEEYNPSARRLDARGRMEMLLFEVVYRRGEQSWTRPFALVHLGSYYTFHGGRLQNMYDWVQNERKILQLSPDADETEKQNYATVKLDYLRLLSTREDDESARECLALIEHLRDLERRNVVDVPDQPMLLTYLQAAERHLWLGNETAARASVQHVYEQLDQIDDPIIHCELDAGVDAFIERIKENIASTRAFRARSH